MMTKEGSIKIVYCMTPGAGLLVVGHGHIGHLVKMHYFFKNLPLYSGAWFRQTICVLVMMSKDRHTTLYNHTYQTGVFVLGHGHYNKPSSEKPVPYLLSSSSHHWGMDQTNYV